MICFIKLKEKLEITKLFFMLSFDLLLREVFIDDAFDLQEMKKN